MSKIRRRTIIWKRSIDDIAVNLAHAKRLKGGVTELITRLVLAETNASKSSTVSYKPIYKNKFP